ncbi:hypothetical protein [Rhodovibrio salinarum]|uniref:Uncharacterized protein n=1 Tax=Rhodovibrio salinarum TaxID=1087 RepID=A0A934QLW2_9PROT|nr:hypothetical protein [Rhodovibrio salinarum]MBK1699246.1 hypothetical protein [Rhodovibrio salinarum]
MTRRHVYKTNFTGGELDPLLLGRGDLRAYENGARELTNVTLHPTGGVSRRPGLQFLAELPGSARLVPFEFSVDQVYVLAFSDYRIDVYQDGLLIVGNLAAPWQQGTLPELAWVQSADTLIVTHPTSVPRLITRDGAGSWSIQQMKFAQIGPRNMVPHAKVAAPDIMLAPAATSGSDVRFVASAPAFTADHLGARLRLHGGEALITAVQDARNVDCDIRVDLGSDEATADWSESAYSLANGWPAVAAFHQNRLVLGGGGRLPNRIFLSKTDDLFNFDPGTGLDDEAIDFELLSDQVNAVRGLLSGRDLQVFTSGGEWRVTGDPLTPTSVQVKRQTRVGSRSDRYTAPKVIDGATVFVGRTGDRVNEFSYSEVESAYLSDDLTLLAKHMVTDVIELDYQPSKRLLYCVQGDGSLAVLTQYRSEQVTAWSRLTTEGRVGAIAVIDPYVYLVVERDGGTFLEVLEAAVTLDAALVGTADPPTAIWSGLDHLEGQTVAVVADGVVQAPRTVSGGAVVLDAPASQLAAGLPYSHVVEPLPPLVSNAIGTGHGIKVRLIEATFRLLDTQSLSVDTGDGSQPAPFQLLGSDLLDAPVAPFSGDKPVRALGWRPAGTTPLWRIADGAPLAFTLLSVTTEIKVND